MLLIAIRISSLDAHQCYPHVVPHHVLRLRSVEGRLVIADLPAAASK